VCTLYCAVQGAAHHKPGRVTDCCDVHGWLTDICACANKKKIGAGGTDDKVDRRVILYSTFKGSDHHRLQLFFVAYLCRVSGMLR